MAPPPAVVKELDAALAALEAADPASAGPRWGAMHKAMLKAKFDPQALMRIVGARDLDAMRRAVRQAKGEAVDAADGDPGTAAGALGPGQGPGSASAPRPGSAPGAAPEVPLDVMQDALRMFRKRLKLSQLDADSKLGHGPTSGTGQHRIQSMVPPRDFPAAVWEALVRAGKLRREGDGFYSIIEQPGGAHW
jgi:hypothetical protein